MSQIKFIPITERLPEPHPEREILVKTSRNKYRVSRFTTWNKSKGYHIMGKPWFWHSATVIFSRVGVISWTYIEGQERGKITLNEKDEFTPEEIVNSVAKYWGVTVDDIKGQSRFTNIKEARAVTSYLFRKHLTKPDGNPVTYEAIGSYIKKDHAAIMYHVREIDKWIFSDKVFREKLESLVIEK